MTKSPTGNRADRQGLESAVERLIIVSLIALATMATVLSALTS